ASLAAPLKAGPAPSQTEAKKIVILVNRFIQSGIAQS
ncbi:MAG: hypothetical protein ACI8UO_004293, partial [Verrucomicrobiales bacterium]